MATATKIPLANVTLSSAVSNVTFSSISGSYTDLVVVLIGTNSGGSANDILLEVGNGSIDTGSNYSSTYLYGNGTSAASGRYTSSTFIEIMQQGSTNPATCIFHINNYANTTTYKSVLARGSDADSKAWASVGLWRSTSAINTIKIYPYSGNLNSGTTLNLYGVL